jgi:CheY-like chemotaxis protein
MAFGFMRQSGGRLELATREGQGTTIRLIFPAVSDSKLPDALGEETVLVVDEDPEPRQFAAAALSDLGYSVLQAASPAAALVRLSNGLRIDLMLTDKLLTGMSGALLAARARRLRPGLPVLFSSFYARAEDCDLLPKPFRPRQLALAVRRMLDAAAGADQRR